MRASNVRAYATTYPSSSWDWTPAFIAAGLIAITVVLFVISEARIRADERSTGRAEDSR
ncbi:hypothetical protein [Mycobacterium asiaticum]|uniref:hypothetical protein n=1 Tax=Mycobacterium asiaticum TaxID=1790 RepID=UPI000A403D12|nr:hypothetical protein [Mycobacterium asiaticum]